MSWSFQPSPTTASLLYRRLLISKSGRTRECWDWGVTFADAYARSFRTLDVTVKLVFRISKHTNNGRTACLPRRADNASSSLSRQHSHHTAQLSSGITFVIFTEVVLVNSAPRGHHAMSMSDDHDKLTRPMDWSYLSCLRARLNTSPATSADLSPDKIPGKILLLNNILFITPWPRLARTSRWAPTMRRCSLPRCSAPRI